MSKGNESAFPFTIPSQAGQAGQVLQGGIQTYNSAARQVYGLTKREYFAGLAMQGLIASCAHHQSGGSNLSAYPSLPKDAVEIADSLLAELDK